MFYRITSLSRNFFSTFTIAKSNIMNINKCYFRYNKTEDKIDITFLLKVKESVRQFNLSRKPTESVENLLTRIGANVQKVVKKGNKKKSSVESQEIEVKVLNGDDKCLPETLNCIDLFSLKGPVQFQIQDSSYEAVFNVPWIENLSLPQSILSGFPVYPEHLVTLNTDRNRCVFNWYTGWVVNDKGNAISEVHVKWELVGTNYAYTPSVQDIGKKLKLECIPGNSEIKGPAVEAISKNVIEAGPGTCPFETRHFFTTTKLTGQSFRCVSYNILADLYCDSDHTRTVLHPYCPPYALHIDYRKQLIMKELLGYNADIMCLQEVDHKIFKSSLRPLLDSEGLEGLFYQKGKEVAEGLACFYRRDRFNFLEEKHIVLSEALQANSELRPIWDAVQTNSNLSERVLNRSTVASATFLESREVQDEILVVGNTHLYFHPDADHIRLIQGGMVIYWLKELINQIKQQFSGKRVSLILCGDFNSVSSSGIYQLYTTGMAPSSLPDWSSKPDEAVQNLSLKQEILLESACGTPQFTNFTSGFADCLDYIYYEKANIEVEQFPGKRVSLILCGDFNSVPSSGIYQLYTTGMAPSSLPDWSSKPDEAVQNLSLKQEILLESACGTPQFTNFTSGFADCLDYIYYEKANIEVEQFPGKRVSLILCGDFNSVPSSGIYQLYTTGMAPSSLPDWSSKPDEAVQNLSLKQEILLESACGTPQFTNFTSGFADCLDYIYYEKANIEVEQVIPFPSTEELQANTALPSIVFPSDHIALISDLKFK